METFICCTDCRLGFNIVEMYSHNGDHVCRTCLTQRYDRSSEQKETVMTETNAFLCEVCHEPTVAEDPNEFLCADCYLYHGHDGGQARAEYDAELEQTAPPLDHGKLMDEAVKALAEYDAELEEWKSTARNP